MAKMGKWGQNLERREQKMDNWGLKMIKDPYMANLSPNQVKLLPKLAELGPKQARLNTQTGWVGGQIGQVKARYDSWGQK